MTRNYLLLAAAALAFAACGNDETDNWNGEIRLRSGLDVQQTTRATTAIQATQFESGENIDVYITEATTGTATTTYDSPLVYTVGDGGALSTTKQPYYPSSGNGVNIFAVYPKGTSLTSGSGSFTIKEDQSDDANYKASDLMTGAPSQNPVVRTEQNIQVKFTHRLTKIDISLTAGDGFADSDLSSAVVYITNTLPEVTFSANGASLGTAAGDAADIKVCTGTAGSAIIVPQTVSSGTGFIKVVAGGGSYVYSLSSDITFAGGGAHTYNITVNKTGLSVTSNIAAWTTGGSTSGSATME